MKTLTYHSALGCSYDSNLNCMKTEGPDLSMEGGDITAKEATLMWKDGDKAYTRIQNKGVPWGHQLF